MGGDAKADPLQPGQAAVNSNVMKPVLTAVYLATDRLALPVAMVTMVQRAILVVQSLDGVRC